MAYKSTGVFRRRWDYIRQIRRLKPTTVAVAVGDTTGDADLTLPLITVDSTALLHGVADLNLSIFTTDFAGHLQVDGAVVLPAITLSAQAHLPVDGAITLPIFATDFAGHLQVDGVVTLPVVTVSATDVPPATATLTFPLLSVQALSGATAHLNLPVLTVEGFGAAGADITLPQIVVVGTATVGLDVSGDSSLTLPIFTLLARTYNGSPPECVVLNTKRFAVSEYNDYAFNSYARFNGVDLAANQNGIYAQDTTDVDDEVYKIKAHIRTGQVEINNGSIHRLRNAYLTYESDGDVRLTTLADEVATRTYYLELQAAIDGMRERRIKFERGIRNRQFDFKIENINGSNLEIDEFEVLTEPIISKRR